MPNEPSKPSSSSLPVFRQLRGYAIDPSLALELRTAPVSQVLLKIPWEELKPGPVGEYLEVIDYDPLSKCFYDAIDLNEPGILAQDGLPPSEGTPQFHQQMVYAVAQLTIHNFERALGRRTLWSPSSEATVQDRKDLDGFVPRLRIYPHALREANAYYSPVKKALLFGYFQASESDIDGEHIPGGMVFACLSHDIIAHETTHALLDGLHRRFNRATNNDMLAFHEAFADLVALFQHFTFPEILRHQIGMTRGDLDAQETLLAQLAGQFGRANGARGALRDAIGKYDKADKRWKKEEPDPAKYKMETEPHLLGSILVAAVFDAFVSIYRRRIADLLRLYTGGSGVLPAGAIHPDLVERLSKEASKAANHVLSMCVRALDYCPPIDLTFGEYLRAIITADVDLVPEDDLNYRVAFVEAFRRRGIYPRDLRTLSVENLVWRGSNLDEFQPSPALDAIFTGLRSFSQKQLYAASREELFIQSKYEREALRDRLKKHILEQHFPKEGRSEAADNNQARDSDFLGLYVPQDENQPFDFEVESLYFASRTGPDGDLLLQAIVQIMQEGEIEGQHMEGGCTLVVDLRKSKTAYCIRKPITSRTRRARQAAYFLATAGTSLRDTYFGREDPGDRREPFAFLHRMGS
jgi:hypothetical protein